MVAQLSIAGRHTKLQTYTTLAPFPGLPHFYLPFVFIIIHRSGRPAKRPGSINHVSGREVDIRVRGQCFVWSMYILNLKVSFLPVKTSSFDHVKVWSRSKTVVKCSNRWSSVLFWQLGPSPPHIHFKSTWSHSRHECSQAFPIFHCSSASMYHCEWKWRVKIGGGGLGMRLHYTVLSSFTQVQALCFALCYSTTVM